MVDLDPQSNAAFALGGDPTQPGTAELLTGKKPHPIKIEMSFDAIANPDLGH